MTDKLTSQNFYSANNESDEIELGKIFRFLLMQSKLIISIVMAVFIISYINYSFTTKKYLIKSLLQYESFNQNIFDPSNSLQMGSSRNSDIVSLIALYKSRTNFLKVIIDLKLNIDIQNLDDDEYIDISILSNESNKLERNKLKFSFTQTSYTLLYGCLNLHSFSAILCIARKF